MELRQLQTFVTITQTESFSRAAEVLGYTQAVSGPCQPNYPGYKMCQGICKKRGGAVQPPSCGNTGIPVFFKASPDTEFLSQQPSQGSGQGDCLHAQPAD